MAADSCLIKARSSATVYSDEEGHRIDTRQPTLHARMPLIRAVGELSWSL